jgi:hypothetical protein
VSNKAAAASTTGLLDMAHGRLCRPVSDFDLDGLMTATHCCKSRFQIGKTMVENRLERDCAARGTNGSK